MQNWATNQPREGPKGTEPFPRAIKTLHMGHGSCMRFVLAAPAGLLCSVSGTSTSRQAELARLHTSWLWLVF